MTQHTPQTTSARRTAIALRRALGTAAVALVGLVGLPQDAEAQARGQRGGDPEQRVERLEQALDLTDRQAVQLRALFEAQAQNRPARGERSGERPDREAMRAQREAHRAELDRQVEALLTPAQVERYRALPAEREAQRGSRGRRGDGR